MAAPLPFASATQAERAIAHVKAVLRAAENSNQHGENMIVLMDQAPALYQRVHALEDALGYLLTAHGEQLHDAFDVAQRLLGSATAGRASAPLSAHERFNGPFADSFAA